MRHRPEAGLAFEKHRWRLPIRGKNPASPEPLFEESDGGALRCRTREEPGQPPVALLEHVDQGALPTPAVQRATLPWTESAARVLSILLTQHARAPHLAFSNRPLPPADVPPADTSGLMAALLGAPWQGMTQPGLVPLGDEETRTRALRLLGTKGCHELYWLAEPPQPLPLARRMTLRALTGEAHPAIAYADFHVLVQACGWLLTSHGPAPSSAGRAPSPPRRHPWRPRTTAQGPAPELHRSGMSGPEP